MNTKLLKKIIKRSGFSRKGLARKMNICRAVLFLKLSGISEFRFSEIQRISEILGLEPKQIEVIFFDKKVS